MIILIMKLKNIAVFLAIVFNLFLLLFALDIFSEGYSVVDLILGLVIHLLPNIILGMTTYWAYKKTTAGAVAFLILGIISTLFFRTYSDPLVFFLISGPLFVIGILLFLSNLVDKKNT